MAAAPPLTLREVSAEQAARAFAGLAHLDPSGRTAPGDDVTAGGRCFELAGEGVRAIYVLSVANGCAWVQAARGEGAPDLSALLDGVITAQAEGLRAIACQTARPGLVKKLRSRGWRVAGWIMRKELTC
jgi:hypothetical protein